MKITVTQLKKMIFEIINEQKSERTVTDGGIESQLNVLYKQDQAERKKYQIFVRQMNNDWTKAAKEWAKKTQRPSDDLFNDRQRINKLKSLLKAVDISKVTNVEWEKIWLLAQHADFDVEFQKHILDLLEKHLGTESQSYKYLYDRISCNLSNTQKYGTQDVCGDDK